MKKKTLEILSGSKWYHATRLISAKNIILNGVFVDYNKESELDFGYGFYLTNDLNKSRTFITSIIDAIGQNSEGLLYSVVQGGVLEFTFETNNDFDEYSD